MITISQQDKVDEEEKGQEKSKKRRCPLCNSLTKTSKTILSVGEYVIIKVDPVTDDYYTKKPTCVKYITTNRIQILGHTYKFKCMVSHMGDLDARSAHYVSWIRKDGAWLKISDDDLVIYDKWPANGYEEEGKVSPYLLFYYEI